jgi:hypothetical protein
MSTEDRSELAEAESHEGLARCHCEGLEALCNECGGRGWVVATALDETLDRVKELIEQHLAREALLENACRAVLLFHSGGDWSRCVEEWRRRAGETPATTKGLCNLVRAALGER